MKVASMAGLNSTVISAARFHAERFEEICCLAKYKKRADAKSVEDLHRYLLGKLFEAESLEELEALQLQVQKIQT